MSEKLQSTLNLSPAYCFFLCLSYVVLSYVSLEQYLRQNKQSDDVTPLKMKEFGRPRKIENKKHFFVETLMLKCHGLLAKK